MKCPLGRELRNGRAEWRRCFLSFGLPCRHKESSKLLLMSVIDYRRATSVLVTIILLGVHTTNRWLGGEIESKNSYGPGPLFFLCCSLPFPPTVR